MSSEDIKHTLIPLFLSTS